MAEQITAADWVMVRRPGITRLLDSVLRTQNTATLTRRRGDTMIALAKTLSAARMGAEIKSVEPDGARWSMKITAEDALP